MFFNKVNIEYTEKEVIEDFIFNLIDIANKNNNKYNDYISIIAILYKLKETYPKFNNIYDRYLKEFDEAKFLQEFERVKYKNNVTNAIPLPIILRSSWLIWRNIVNVKRNYYLTFLL